MTFLVYGDAGHCSVILISVDHHIMLDYLSYWVGIAGPAFEFTRSLSSTFQAR